MREYARHHGETGRTKGGEGGSAHTDFHAGLLIADVGKGGESYLGVVSAKLGHLLSNVLGLANILNLPLLLDRAANERVSGCFPRTEVNTQKSSGTRPRTSKHVLDGLKHASRRRGRGELSNCNEGKEDGSFGKHGDRCLVSSCFNGSCLDRRN